jgi:hypothetical protein
MGLESMHMGRPGEESARGTRAGVSEPVFGIVTSTVSRLLTFPALIPKKYIEGKNTSYH